MLFRGDDDDDGEWCSLEILIESEFTFLLWWLRSHEMSLATQLFHSYKNSLSLSPFFCVKRERKKPTIEFDDTAIWQS